MRITINDKVVEVSGGLYEVAVPAAMKMLNKAAIGSVVTITEGTEVLWSARKGKVK